MNEPLPDVHEGVVDGATLDALFDDIAREARVFAVLVKGGAEALAEGGGVTLDAARDALKAGSVRAVQVRYEHRGVVWMDTLLRAPGGYRVVRMAAG
ncbi:MAG: hypothetical protein U0324_40575 [Polyangiales bacterium]